MQLQKLDLKNTSEKKTNIQRILFLIFLGIALLFSRCDKFKDIETGSPEQIVSKAVTFYTEKNADKFIRLLSNTAIKKMETSLQALRTQFKTLDVQYRKDLAEKMNMSPDSLVNLKMTDYIKFNMNLNAGGMGSDNILFPVNHIMESDYIDTEIKETKAVVKYKNTILHLVKEKNFWKIDTFDLPNNKTKSTENPGE